MKYKKSLLILIMAIFLVSIAGVCASDANDTAIAGDDSNQMELSSDNEISEDDLQTGEENTILTQNDDETVSAQTDSERLSEGSGTYEDLINEIGDGGDKNLSKSYYSYNGGNTIVIKYSGVINGNGAIIDMAGASIRTFYVAASGVTIKDLTIKNAKFNVGSGGAIFFSSSGTVENCNFTRNIAGDTGGAINFDESGTVINCNFTDNKAENYGGAINMGSGTVTNCNFNNNYVTNYRAGAINMGSGNVTNCNFTDNHAPHSGAINMGSGNVTNCNFADNRATYEGGAIYFSSNGEVTNCNFTNNKATSDDGGAVYIYSGNVINCNFINNQAFNGGSVYFMSNGEVTNCNFTNNQATGNHGYGGAIYFYMNSNGIVVNCNFTNNSAYYGGGVYFSNSSNVTNCNFTDNVAGDTGGAVNFAESGTVTNCNFNNNKATSHNGGAVNMNSGPVTNCNFTDNVAGDTGGAVNFAESGTLTNCNFNDNKAENYGGAVNMNSGPVSNCNFNNNKATSHNGGAVNMNSGTVTNCNFTDNIGGDTGGAVNFAESGALTNCNFNDNKAENYGGAVNMDLGNVTNCNFNNNSAQAGGAIFNSGDANVVNCNFINNKAIDNNGGAIKMHSAVVENCNFTNNQAIGDNSYGGAVYSGSKGIVISCNFADNYAGRHGGAMYGGAADTCIFKPYSDATYNTLFLSPTLNADNFTTAYDSGEKVTFDLKTNSSLPVDNGNILISIYNNNGSWFGNYSCLSGEGWIVDLPVGSYYVIYDTEYAGFQAINRTITINKGNSVLNISDVTLDYGTSTNVTVTTKGAVGITAKINDENVTVVNNFTIPISGLNVGTYTLTVTTIADANHVAVTKTANITVNKADSTLTVGDIVFDYKSSGSCEVSFTNAKGINASVINQPNAIVNVNNNTIIVSGLDAGTYTLTVTTIADANYNDVTRNATITVNKLKTQLTASAVTATYNINKDLVITLKDANGNPLSGVEISVDLNGVKKYTTDKNGQIKVATKGLAAKAYTTKITFNGNANYINSAKDVKVTVKKATPILTAKKATLKAKTKTKKYAVTLKDNTGKAMNKVQITLKVKGKTYKATTNAKGFKIKKLTKKGTYKATVTFKGNSNYNKITKTVKIVIK